MLGLDNPIHIVFVLVVLLLVFGAKRLPEMGKSMGEGLRGFKDSISGDQAATHMLEHSSTALGETAATGTEPTAERAPERVQVSPGA
jgi:sec-independent protein translocase protein TatA